MTPCRTSESHLVPRFLVHPILSLQNRFLIQIFAFKDFLQLVNQLNLLVFSTWTPFREDSMLAGSTGVL